MGPPREKTRPVGGELIGLTLLEFLQARLTEDELTALAAVDGSPEWRNSLTFRDVKDENGRFIVEADREHPSVEQLRASPAIAPRAPWRRWK